MDFKYLDSNILISTIVPVYNTQNYIQRCIDSIQKQTITGFELIIIDDGSDDCSGQLCDEAALDNANTIIIHKKNSGQSTARNIALEIVSGQYLYFCDSDDKVEPTLFENSVAVMESENTDIVRFQSYIHQGNDCKKTEFEFNNRTISCKDKFNLLYYHVLNYSFGYELCYSLFKTSIFQLNVIRFPDGINVAEDLFVLSCYLLYADSMYLMDIPLYHYYIRNESTMGLSRSVFLLNQFNQLASFLYKRCDDEVTRSKFYLLHSKLIYSELYKINKQPIGIRLWKCKSVFDNIEDKLFYYNCCQSMSKCGKTELIKEYGGYFGLKRYAICKFAIEHNIILLCLRNILIEIGWLPIRIQKKIHRRIEKIRVWRK